MPKFSPKYDRRKSIFNEKPLCDKVNNGKSFVWSPELNK